MDAQCCHGNKERELLMVYDGCCPLLSCLNDHYRSNVRYERSLPAELQSSVFISDQFHLRYQIVGDHQSWVFRVLRWFWHPRFTLLLPTSEVLEENNVLIQYQEPVELFSEVPLSWGHNRTINSELPDLYGFSKVLISRTHKDPSSFEGSVKNKPETC